MACLECRFTKSIEGDSRNFSQNLWHFPKQSKLCTLIHGQRACFFLNMFVFVNSALFILFPEFIMSWIIMIFHDVLRDTSPSSEMVCVYACVCVRVCVCVCVCVCVFIEDRNILMSFLIG